MTIYIHHHQQHDHHRHHHHLFLHCALAAAQRIAIGPVCLFVGVFVGLLPR